MPRPSPVLISAARRLWGPGSERQSAVGRTALTALRVAYAVLRDFMEGRLALRATSLVYTTLLSMVPMLAFSFSVLKGFGVHNQLEPTLKGLLAPLGPQGSEITHRVIEFVDRVNVGVLGAVGLGILVYTVVSLIEKVEDAFNELWGVNENRPMSQRIPQYITALLIGPVLVFSMFGGLAAMTDAASHYGELPGVGSAVEATVRVVPLLTTVVFFSGLYFWLPNRDVDWQAAVIGGLTAAALWIAGGKIFALSVASSAQYQAIYSAFATALVFMIWIYASWMIVLIGCAVAYYCQHPLAARYGRQPPADAPAVAERLALLVFRQIALAFRDGKPPPPLDALSRTVGYPQSAVLGTVDHLIEADLVRRTADPRSGLVPARPLTGIPVWSIIEAVRLGTAPAAQQDAVIMPLERRITLAVQGALAGMTAHDLLDDPVLDEAAHRADQARAQPEGISGKPAG